MNIEELQNLWAEKYQVVLNQLDSVKKVPCVATAFNTNIDAILKISGKRLKQLITKSNLKLTDIEDTSLNCFRKPEDVLIGIVKCFSHGFAEEWITEDISVYNWMKENLGYDKLQMGGQAGIIANVLALLGVQKVIAHTNSHPELQAKQFLNLDNLYSFDDRGNLKKASQIARNNDVPLIHWIIEFDGGDCFTYQGKEFVCPRSNRFIATYDPLNLNLVMNKNFNQYFLSHKADYLFLSGFHALLENCNGLELIDNAVDILKQWRVANSEMFIHLEIASVQDKAIRLAIINKIAPFAHSIGLNERETIDLLEIFGEQNLAEQLKKENSSCLLYKALLFLKKKLKAQRIQLHMLGFYLTLQDKNFPIAPKQTLSGMMTAAVVSASKAYVGELSKSEHLTKTLGLPVSEYGLDAISHLSADLNKEELLTTGVCETDNYYLSAIPTILVKNPKTLVGMGDTISSVSLLAAR